MFWVFTLYLLIYFNMVVRMTISESNLSLEKPSCTLPLTSLFESVNVSSFIDENRYIRMNISWEKPKAKFSNFEMEVDTNCSALYGERNISVEQHYVIQPSMERLTHPAEPLLHGCKYDIILFIDVLDENEACTISETVDYTIPECVEEVCECGSADAPYKFSYYALVMDSVYTLRFNKTDKHTELSLEEVFEKIWYTNINSNRTISIIQTEHIIFDNVRNELVVPFYDFHNGNSYIVNMDILVDYCEYHFSTKVEVPYQNIVKGSTHQNIIYSAALIVIFLSISLLLLKRNSKILAKIKRRIPYFHNTPTTANPGETIVSLKITKEVINSQYTPLEFILNAHNFDKFEFPRNKIILKNEIGGGAFGKVYKADVYGLHDNPGYIVAAAKKPMENAPSEEISDFLAEIETMKRISFSGGHPNIINILACVTVDQPYIMIMEYITCGSLKSYLTNLRREWEDRKRRARVSKNYRHFFPDSMIVENYLQSVSATKNFGNEKLKYCDLAFENYTGSTQSFETNSYITPATPSTPSSPIIIPSSKKPCVKISLRPDKNELIKISPESPTSVTSSELYSITETLLTSLESSPVTPLVDFKDDLTEHNIEPFLDNKELQNFALQIANGMAFLEKIEITHRDLAARNILINEEKSLKISDFGMARAGVYVNLSHKRQPLRWMAPEAIENRRCDSKTDVWSFGVVLWEIGSLGAFPYKNLGNEQVIGHILQGKRLERPQTCTDRVYDLMQQCWHKNPDHRPSFEEIAQQLDTSNGKIYVEFNKLSPEYVFPPT